MIDDLFDKVASRVPALTPLAERLRPETIEEIEGQPHLLDKGRFLRAAIEADRVPSLILCGPPGTGKTTLARCLAKGTGARFAQVSATDGTIKEVREILGQAAEQRRAFQRRTILFIDEIHRFNKAQQDALLGAVEAGIVILIGATTENPSFSVNAALLSRCKVLRLESLDEAALLAILRRALDTKERGLGHLGVTAQEEALRCICASARGDARYALSLLEMAAQHALSKNTVIDVATVEAAGERRALLYDKGGEEHYNIISAFIKSLRGSDPDAALYWMFRMLEAGEDPMFILRRMLIFASEDVGNADPHALQTVVAADQSFQRIGMPEGAYPLAQACTYLACAPKSNAMVDAISKPRRDIEQHGPLPVPSRLRNAASKLMKEWGYGQGYRYPHDEGGYAPGETYLPDELMGSRYYEPRAAGLEIRIGQRLAELRHKKGV
ncbi:MAG: replication-associated recombination protein A [Myxococcota bacterium]|jgi:putative ATPase|nr:replication-associated recombination protein A [Myxococcota bacterium]